jgi:DNA-binding SARP family transcriptional activator/tetratricopeptide (TPR) repeat protein
MSTASPPVSRTPRIELLGVPRLVLPQGEPHVLERRDAALLALLALEGATLRSRASALLWPDLSEKAARSNLRQRLFRLRTATGEAFVLAEDALRIAPHVSVELREARASLAADPDACDGALLGSHDYSDNDVLDEWVQAAREGWRQSCLETLASEASRREAAMQIAGALRYAHRIVADDPLQEHGHRRLMRLHYLRGDRSAALAAFVACRDRLMAELGVAPDPETLQLAKLIESGSGLPRPAPAPRPVATLRPPRMVGNDAAWHTLALACDTGRSVLVDGDAGAGKTRLLSDFAASMSGAAATFCGRPGDAQLPYALLAQVVDGLTARFGAPEPQWAAAELARIAPRLGAAPERRLDHLRFRQALEQALAGWRAAGLALVVLDDLHYADDATLDLLPALIKPAAVSAEQPGIAWLMGVRSAEMPAALQAGVDALDERSLLRVAVEPLDPVAIRDLLESLGIDDLDGAAWAPVLARHCGGNPLFLLETLRALLHQKGPTARMDPNQRLPVPSTVQQLIERRLRRLNPGALLLAQVAAVAGQDFTPDLAAAVLKRSALEIAGSWAELEGATVLSATGFAHDLVQEATTSATPAPLARLLHLEAARCLEGIGGEPSRLARHWQQAQQWRAAGDAFMQGAITAEKASQRKLEVELAGEAADCFVKVGDQAREFSARERSSRAASYVEPFEKRVRRAEQLIELAVSPEQRCIALQVYARVLVEDLDNEKVVSAAGESRALAAALGNDTRAFMAACIEAWALSRMNRIEEAERLVAKFLPIAKARGRDPRAARAMAEFGCALMTCDRADEADALFSDALQAATALEDWGLCQEVQTHKAWVHHYRGDIREAALSYESARALAPRLGAEAKPTNLTDAILGRFYLELGRCSESLALLEATLAKQLHNANPNQVIVYTAQAALARLHLMFGQPARAASVLTEPGRDAAPTNQRQYFIARARIAIHLGQPAIEFVRQALRAAEREGGAQAVLMVQAFLARLLPADEGAALASQGCARSLALRLHLTEWPLRLAACDTLRRAGDVRHAARLALELMSHCEHRAPVTFDAPEYGWVASQALREAGDDEAANRALRAAMHWIHAVALPNVPPEFRSSFLERNPVNRAIALAAQRLPDVLGPTLRTP